MKRYLLILCTILASACEQSSGQTHVQTTTLYQTTTATTIAKAFGAASTSGNLIVVHVDWDGQTRSITSVTDNKGNSYARINGPTNWNGPSYRAELWYAYNITGGGGAITVTAHLSGAPTSFSQIYISEYSGIVSIADPLDKNSVAIGNTAAVSSGSKTTSYNHELIYGASIGASGTLSKGATFTSRSTANSNIIEDKNAAAGGTFDANFTSAGGNWIAQMATFISTSSVFLLPVELLSFSGKCEGNHIALNWSTSSESNNDFFTIEQSVNGNAWQSVGTIQSAGNSSVIQTYSFVAGETNGEISYFRLKQTDRDGKFQYFNTIQVSDCNLPAKKIIVYPNPTNGTALSGRINEKVNEPYSIDIFDKTGNLVSHFNSDKPEFNAQFSHTLNPGIYYARFYSAGFSKTESFLVIH